MSKEQNCECICHNNALVEMGVSHPFKCCEFANYPSPEAVQEKTPDQIQYEEDISHGVDVHGSAPQQPTEEWNEAIKNCMYEGLDYDMSLQDDSIIYKHTYQLYSNIRSLLSKSREEGYNKGITDKKVWNGVYEIGAEEERTRIKGVIEEKKEKCKGGTFCESCEALQDLLDSLEK